MNSLPVDGLSIPSSKLREFIDQTKADAWRAQYEQAQLKHQPYQNPRVQNGQRIVSGVGPATIYMRAQTNSAPAIQSTVLPSHERAQLAQSNHGLLPNQPVSAQVNHMQSDAYSVGAETLSPLRQYVSTDSAIVEANWFVLLKEKFRARWPSKNLVLSQTGDGLSVWMRDSELSEASIVDFINEVHTWANAQGVIIKAIHVNGILVGESHYGR